MRFRGSCKPRLTRRLSDCSLPWLSRGASPDHEGAARSPIRQEVIPGDHVGCAKLFVGAKTPSWGGRCRSFGQGALGSCCGDWRRCWRDWWVEDCLPHHTRRKDKENWRGRLYSGRATRPDSDRIQGLVELRRPETSGEQMYLIYVPN